MRILKDFKMPKIKLTKFKMNNLGDLEDLNISAINSRKLAVRALLGIHGVCEVPVE